MYFNGIREKNISDIHVENCNIVAEKGADIRYSDGVQLENVNIIQSEGEGYTVANCRNVTLEDCADADGAVSGIFQYRNENVVVK